MSRIRECDVMRIARSAARRAKFTLRPSDARFFDGTRLRRHIRPCPSPFPPPSLDLYKDDEREGKTSVVDLASLEFDRSFRKENRNSNGLKNFTLVKGSSAAEFKIDLV
jgi:hypothetical protein